MDLKYGLFIHALRNYLVEYVGVSNENRAVYWVMSGEIKVGYIQLRFQGRMRFNHIHVHVCSAWTSNPSIKTVYLKEK